MKCYILNNATADSLIILDEVGRGTSTFDGLSIAWSLTEYIHSEIKAKTLFATHYHELTQLEEDLEGVKNYSVSVKENNDNIVFLHKIVPGEQIVMEFRLLNWQVYLPPLLLG